MHTHKTKKQLIAELEDAQRELQEMRRLKSQFLATMSHELRTPLNAIIGFTRLVLRRGKEELSDRNRENLEKVKASADHLLNLINDILDLSKIESGQVEIKPGWVNVNQMIHKCCETVTSALSKPNVHLTIDVPPDMDEAFTDQTRLRQIMINLLSNAFKFTDAGEVVVQLQRKDEALLLTVTDTGIGIPQDHMEAIFEEFRQVDGSHTRRYSGSGLGLTITKKLVDLLGGTINLTSAMGKGTTFTVQLPSVFGKTHIKNKNGYTSVEHSKPGDRVIVVIDDDPNVAVLLREELSEEGYHVASATRAEEGIELVRKLKPIAVTVDIIMPGKDGWETIAMLKADPQTQNVPIIVMSASDNVELGFRLGVLDYLVKPIERDALITALGRIGKKDMKDVLVVDDERIVRNLLSDLLGLHGFEVREAANGQEALHEIEKKIPDAILLDLMMPVMDGFQLVEKLQTQEDWRRIPVIVVTAKNLSLEEQIFLHERVGHVVQKGNGDPYALGTELKALLAHYEK